MASVAVRMHSQYVVDIDLASLCLRPSKLYNAGIFDSVGKKQQRNDSVCFWMEKTHYVSVIILD